MPPLSQAFGEVTPSPKTQASIAYARVRQDILAGRLAPGEKLRIAELAALIDVSPGAIREALSRLVPEQLVCSQDQKGFIVAPLSVEDLQELTDLRCEIEEIALRRSVARGGAAWEADILASAHRLRSTRQMSSDNSLVPEWVNEHGIFHRALISACGNQRMIDLHGLLYEQSERYRGLSAHVEEARDVPGEHQSLVEAALARDADLLVERTLGHIRRTTAIIVAGASQLA